MEMHTVEVANKQIHWLEEGSGFPVVFIHGIPTSPLLWRHVIPRIKNARCLAFEMLGYGESMDEARGNGELRNISVSQQADYLVAWLRELGIERAVFAGHDLGGGVAQIAAVRHPEMCAGLFLTNAICYDSWPIPSVKAMRMAAPVTSHLPDAMGKQVLRTLMYRGHDDHEQAKESLELHWRPYAEHGGAESLLRQMQALDVEDTLSVAAKLPSLDVPARIVWGAADHFQKIHYGERLAKDLHAPLRRIEGGKHFTPEDHPDIIAEEINRLVETVH
ncbi:alpha/beta fold hydrolase [Proteobacteria bacterium 005FR1]|nr:alpha/beta fold hydrolase [Proteobacteria bacterium 005FR1]